MHWFDEDGLFMMSCSDKIEKNNPTYQFGKSMNNLINRYFLAHPLAKDCGGEYIYQSDSAQVDAIKLVSDICEEYIKFFGEDIED